MSQACARFLCCERPAWQTTAMPVGMWVSRTADSVLLTCWPPAPPERIVSVRTSASLMSILILSSTTGTTHTTVAAGVEMDGRKRHEPVHTGFGLEPTIGVVTADLDGGRFDAGLLALGLFQIFDLGAGLF